MTTPEGGEAGEDDGVTATDGNGGTAVTDGSGGDSDASAESEGAVSAADEDSRFAVLLDYLPHGRVDDDRPQYKKNPIGYAVGETDFRLFELTLDRDADVGIGDRVLVEPMTDRERVVSLRSVAYDDLSNAAHAELEYVVDEIVTANERRFVDFYNDAQPITLRLHQLNLLPGIGKKLRNNILDERKRGPFESFDEVEERVSGLHSARDILIERILEELRDDSLKYKTFVRRQQSS